MVNLHSPYNIHIMKFIIWLMQSNCIEIMYLHNLLCQQGLHRAQMLLALVKGHTAVTAYI